MDEYQDVNLQKLLDLYIGQLLKDDDSDIKLK